MAERNPDIVKHQNPDLLDGDLGVWNCSCSGKLLCLDGCNPGMWGYIAVDWKDVLVIKCVEFGLNAHSHDLSLLDVLRSIRVVDSLPALNIVINKRLGFSLEDLNMGLGELLVGLSGFLDGWNDDSVSGLSNVWSGLLDVWEGVLLIVLFAVFFVVWLDVWGQCVSDRGVCVTDCGTVFGGDLRATNKNIVQDVP